jgi:hypothetical protein
MRITVGQLMRLIRETIEEQAAGQLDWSVRDEGWVKLLELFEEAIESLRGLYSPDPTVGVRGWNAWTEALKNLINGAENIGVNVDEISILGDENTINDGTSDGRAKIIDVLNRWFGKAIKNDKDDHPRLEDWRWPSVPDAPRRDGTSLPKKDTKGNSAQQSAPSNNRDKQNAANRTGRLAALTGWMR